MTTRLTTADRLRYFESEHGYVIENALAIQERDMLNYAEEAESAAWCPSLPPGPPKEGYITLGVSGPGALLHMAAMFRESAAKAAAALAAWQELNEAEE